MPGAVLAACGSNYVHVLTELMNHASKDDIEKMDEALMSSVIRGNQECATLLIKAGVPLNSLRQVLNLSPDEEKILYGNQDDYSVLMTTIATGSDTLFNLLLEHGTDVKLESRYFKFTALHAAAKSDNPKAQEWIKKLVEKGANVQALMHTDRYQDEQVFSPLDLAITSKREANIVLLKSLGGKPTTYAFLQSGRAQEAQEMTKMIECGFDPNGTVLNKSGNSDEKNIPIPILTDQLHEGHVAASIVLLDAGAAPNASKDNWWYAWNCENISLWKKLIEKGLKIDVEKIVDREMKNKELKNLINDELIYPQMADPACVTIAFKKEGRTQQQKFEVKQDVESACRNFCAAVIEEQNKNQKTYSGSVFIYRKNKEGKNIKMKQDIMQNTTMPKLEKGDVITLEIK